MKDKKPFWQTTSLEDMTHEQWESLCDGCGLCCLHRLEDEESGAMVLTNIACQFLDLKTCQCSDYCNRKTNMSNCLTVTPKNIKEYSWLPVTCAYRLIAEGDDLEEWHPLISGDKNTVHKAEISMRGELVSEKDVDDIEKEGVAWFNEQMGYEALILDRDESN